MDFRNAAKIVLFCLVLLFPSYTKSALTTTSINSPPQGLDQASWTKILDQIDAEHYRFKVNDHGPAHYTGNNRTHNLSFAVLPEGKLQVSSGPSAADKWSLSLELAGWGTEEHMVAPKSPEVEHHGARLDFHRGLLTEWYINDRLGLEQGFTLQGPLRENGEEIILNISGSSTLKPQFLADGSGLTFLDSNGVEQYHYSGLKAWDDSGRILPASFLAGNLNSSTFHMELHVDARDARYPITIDPVIAQVKKLVANDAATYDYFGFSVAISNDTIVVGAPAEDGGGTNAGAVYIFDRDQGGANNWGQIKKLASTDLEAGDSFGNSLAISGDTLVVAAYKEDSGFADSGAAYIFERHRGGADSWGQVRKLKAGDPGGTDYFGYSVAISDDTVVVGALYESMAGAAYIFERDWGGADNWGQVEKLTANDSESYDRFGHSVAISGDTAVVGAYSESSGGTGAGAAYLFERDEGGTDNWGQIKKLASTDLEAGDSFGWSVAISGDIVVVSAPNDDIGAMPLLWENGGSAYLFHRDLGGIGTWSQIKQFTAAPITENSEFGVSVAINGDIVVIGSEEEIAGYLYAGAAYVYEWDQGGANNWGLVKKLTNSDPEEFDLFGKRVVVSNSTVVTTSNDDSIGGYAGAAYVSTWQSYVAPHGSNNVGCSSTPASPCKTIQYALDESERGIVKAACGRYQENIFLNTTKHDAEINGGWNTNFTKISSDASCTVIDGGSEASKSVVRIQPPNTGLRLTNLTLENGVGGISALNSDGRIFDLTVKQCIIRDNSEHGIELYNQYGDADLNIDRCVITDNTTGAYGGGLEVLATSGQSKINIVNSIFGHNSAEHDGGAIRVYGAGPSQTSLSIASTTVTKNIAKDGGGLYLRTFDGDIQTQILNSIIWGNSATSSNNGDDIYLVEEPGTTLSVGSSYSDIGVIYDTQNLYQDYGNNINNNPLFQNLSYRDYHLRGDSPCIDKALCGHWFLLPPSLEVICSRVSPYTDFEGDARPELCGTMCDMGADEYVADSFPWILFMPAILGGAQK